jgi:hypothetical protein
MTTAQEWKMKMKLKTDEMIRDIKQELALRGAREVSLKRNIVYEELDDQFSVLIERINMSGVVIHNPYEERDFELSFEELQEEMGFNLLIVLLDEIQSGRFEIYEELSEE